MHKQNILRYASVKCTNPPPPYKNKVLFQNSFIYSKTKDYLSKNLQTNSNTQTKNIRLLTQGSQPYHKNQTFLNLNNDRDKRKRQPVEMKPKEQEKKNIDPQGLRLQKGISQKQFKFVGNFVNLKKNDYIRKDKPAEYIPVWIKKDAPPKVFNNFVDGRGNSDLNGKPAKEVNSLNVATQYWNSKQQQTSENKPSTGYIKRTVKTENDQVFGNSYQSGENSNGNPYRKSFKNAMRKTQIDECPLRNQDQKVKMGVTFNMEKPDRNGKNFEKMSFEKVFITKENKGLIENKGFTENKQNRRTTCIRQKTGNGIERQRYTTNLNDQRLSKSPQNIKLFAENSTNIVQKQQKLCEPKIFILNNEKYLGQNQRKKTRLNTDENEKQSKLYMFRQKTSNTIEPDLMGTSQLAKKQLNWKKDLVMMEKIGEGTFGKVYKAKLRQQSEKQIYAVKKVYIDKKYKSRQLEIVQQLNHPQVMKVHNVFVTTKQSSEQYLNIVMDYYDKNLFEVINESSMKGVRQSLPTSKNTQLQQKVLIYQILKGLSYIHSLKICHRDIKPHNMLVKGWQLVLCDFGSAKKLNPGQANLSYICSRCYRAPELIFGSTAYTTQIDMWSVACVIIEMLHGLPLFIGENSLDHLLEVIKVVGTPTRQEVLQMNSSYDISEYDLPMIKTKSLSRIFPYADTKLVDLVNKLMVYNPHERLSAIEALTHSYFDDLRRQDTFKIIQNQLPKDKLDQLYHFSQKQIDLCSMAQLARNRSSKTYLKEKEPTINKKSTQIRQILTPLWWRKKRQL